MPTSFTSATGLEAEERDVGYNTRFHEEFQLYRRERDWGTFERPIIVPTTEKERIVECTGLCVGQFRTQYPQGLLQKKKILYRNLTLGLATIKMFNRSTEDIPGGESRMWVMRPGEWAMCDECGQVFACVSKYYAIFRFVCLFVCFWTRPGKDDSQF